jgi:hypothetical protein
LGSQYTGRRQTQDVNLIIVYDTIITQAWQIMKNNHNNFWNNIGEYYIQSNTVFSFNKFLV